jgi:membrane protein DedA with SNARE-associated domain
MAERLLAQVSVLIIGLIAAMGYGGVVALMGLESACIPLPSEVIMPFAGYLVSTGRFQLQAVAAAGALGCLLGSYLAYLIGLTGGRRAFLRYGAWVLISRRELDLAERFFARWGSITIFLARLLPVIRTFIAFPAGVARMGLWRFSIYTLLGSYLWCLALAYAGMKLGQHWRALAPYLRRSDNAILALIILAAGAFVYLRLRSADSKASSMAKQL